MIRRMASLMVAAVFVAGLALPVVTQAQTKPAQAHKTTKRIGAKPINGTVKSSMADSLVVMVGDKEVTFVIDKDTVIQKAGKKAMAQDIMAKDAATVTWKEVDGKMIASRVVLRASK